MTAASPTIVATCAGLDPDPSGWAEAVYGPVLQHAISLARVAGRAPRVLHVNTAGGDPRQVEGAELEAARLAGAEASHLRFFPRRNVVDLEATVLGADVVWVSGGSLVNLLAVWRAHGLDAVLRRAWQAGVVLAGGSAGALAWMSGGVTASFGPASTAVPDGLGLLPFSLGVHDDSDPARGPVYRAAVARGDLPSGWALDEGTGLVFSGTELVEAITQRPEGRVHEVDAAGSRSIPTRIVG